MRRLVALIALAVAASLVVLPAGTASAGGPTSVHIVNYEGTRAAAALTGGEAYEALSAALDVMNYPRGETRSPDSLMKSRIRLTWMIHDVQPWRVDSLVIRGQDVWVDTVQSADGSDPFATPTIRHRAKDTKLLLATLTSLGVIGAAAPSDPMAGAAATATPIVSASADPTTIDPALTSTASTTRPSASGGALTGVFAGGLAVGVLAALMALRLPARRKGGGRKRATESRDGNATHTRSGTSDVADAPVLHLSDRLPVVGFACDPDRAPRR